MNDRAIRRSILATALPSMLVLGVYLAARGLPQPPNYAFLNGHRLVSIDRSVQKTTLFKYAWQDPDPQTTVDRMNAELEPRGFSTGYLDSNFSLLFASWKGPSESVKLVSGLSDTDRRAINPKAKPNWITITITRDDPVPTWLRNLTNWP